MITDGTRIRFRCVVAVGPVTIKAGNTALCTVTLNAGTAACTLRPSQLRPGTYQLTATYNGSDVHDRSTSAAHKLTVTK
jgi:hypothetical protein